jgi:hypothetical protein
VCGAVNRALVDEEFLDDLLWASIVEEHRREIAEEFDHADAIGQDVTPKPLPMEPSHGTQEEGPEEGRRR